jgi:hypothetical protein
MIKNKIDALNLNIAGYMHTNLIEISDYFFQSYPIILILNILVRKNKKQYDYNFKYIID